MIPVSTLDATPVLGVNMANVSLLRLDLAGGLAPGNKSYKLRHNLDQARRLGVRRLLSFGGAWSNHLHALAAVGHSDGFDTVGIVRGEAHGSVSPMLADAKAWGMQVVHVSRTDYRRRQDPAYLREIQAQFAPCLVIPEGGSNVAGALGCMDIGEQVRSAAPFARRVVLAVGTGTTLAGVAAALAPAAPVGAQSTTTDIEREVIGVSALKGASDLEQRVESLLSTCDADNPASWRILHDYHCGGFARVNPALREFMLAFERSHRIKLEPVYTGKMLFAIHQLLGSGRWDSQQPILAIHTGGLQGRRGYPWLDATPGDGL